MELVTLESEAYKQMIFKIENIENRVAEIVKEAQYPLDERWLDNQEVCKLLHISKRLLQEYRDKRMISFSQINHKIYYKASDVQKFLVKYFVKSLTLNEEKS